MPKPVTIFISYASEDDSIANQLNNTLQQTFGNDVQIYMDSFILPKGGTLTESIRKCIEATDILIVISTGRMRIAHSWCGLELGAFMMTSSYQEGLLQGGIKTSLKGSVVCLCWSTATSPPALAGRLHVPLAVSDESLQLTDAEYRKELEDRPRNGSDHFVQLLYQVHETIHSVHPSASRKIEDDLHIKGFEFKVAIRQHYLTRVKSILEMERQLTLNYDVSSIMAPGRRLGADSWYSLSNNAGNVFGLADTAAGEHKPWLEFEANAVKKKQGVFWLETIHRLLGAANDRGPSRTDDRLVILANDGKSLYRPILTTLSKFNNRRQEASIYMVEIEKYWPHQHGREDTTRLLNGIQAVCRFRFLFLEKTSTFVSVNAQKCIQEDNLDDFSNKLLEELHRLEGDMAIAKLDQPSDYADFISQDKLEEMMTVWGQLRSRLIGTANNAVAKNQDGLALPNILEELRSNLLPLNTDLLDGMAKKLVEISKSDCV